MKRLMAAAVLAIVFGGVAAQRASAAAAKPDVPVNYCQWAWWDIECWF